MKGTNPNKSTIPSILRSSCLAIRRVEQAVGRSDRNVAREPFFIEEGSVTKMTESIVCKRAT